MLLTGVAACYTNLPPSADVLGPVELPRDDMARLLVRCPLTDGVSLARALRAAAGVRSARRAPGSVRIRIDPVDLA